MSSTAGSTSMTPSQVHRLLQQGRGLLLIEAIICLAGGALSVLFPVLASEGLEIMLGFICLGLGILSLIRSVMGGVEHRGATAATGVLLGVLGALLLIWPFEGLEALTLLLAAGVFVRGFADCTGVPHRSTIAPGLQIVSGIAGIIVGVLLVLWYPSDALWAPGLLFGIQLIFFGMMLYTLWVAVGGVIADPPSLAVRE